MKYAVERVIKSGVEYGINPSMAYAGVDSGTVRIVWVGTLEEANNIPNISGFYQKDLASVIQDFIDVDYGDYDYNETWVIYHYPYSLESIYLLAFPIDTFARHISER